MAPARKSHAARGGLGAQDGAAQLGVRRLDLGAESARHARSEARVEIGNLLREPLGGEQHARAALRERFEGVQQLELGLALAADELDVFEHEQIAVAAVAGLELGGAVGADRRQQIVRELFARGEHDARRRVRARFVRPPPTARCDLPCPSDATR